MTRRDEPIPWPNSRTDAAEYADLAVNELAPLLGLTEHEEALGLLRDAIAEAFAVGEHQGEVRAVRVVSIARASASTIKAPEPLDAVLKLLAPEVEEGKG